MLTSTFNTKSTELESRIKDADIIAKNAVTKANSIKSDLDDYAKKDDVANDITTIKNDYVTNASLTSRLIDLKIQHIATEVKTIDDKTKKNKMIKCIYCTNVKLFHLNIHQIKLIYGNQLGLIIIAGI